jgi:ABC-type lipoprotein release transport system permease subunit
VTIVVRVVIPLVGTADPDDGALLPLDTFRAICSDQLVAAIDSNTSALVELHHDEDAAAVRQSLDPQQYLVQTRFVPGSVTAIDDIRQVPVVVAVLVGLLAVAAIGHALALAVRRRRRDLAVLRALGLRPGQTAAVVRWQATTLTAVALLAGIPVGLLGARLLWSDIVDSSHLLVRTDVRVLGLAAVAVAMFTIALGLAWWPGHRASHLRPADILRGE